MPINDLDQPFSDQYLKEEEDINVRINQLQEQIGRLRGMSPESNGQPEGSFTVGQHIAEIPKAILGGATHAFENAAEALDEVWDYAGENWEALHNVHESMPDVPFSEGHMIHPEAPQTATGQITQSVSQFLVGFIPAAKAIKAVGLTAKFGSTVAAMAAGGVADYAVFDPTEGRVADAIQGLHPDLKIPIISYLASDEDDSAIESRLKNVIEGAALGAMGDILIKGIKGIKGSIGRKPDNIVPAKDAPLKEGVRLDDAVDDMEQTRLNDLATDESPVVKDPSPEAIAEIKDQILKNEPVDIDRAVYGMANPDHLNNIEDVMVASVAMAKKARGILDATGQQVTKTHDGIKGYWKDNGIKMADANKTYGDTDELAERALGMRMLHADIVQQTTDLASKIRDGLATDKDRIRFERGLTVTTQLNAMVRGVQTNIAQALNSMKINVGAGMLDNSVLDAMMHGRGGAKTINGRADAFLRLSKEARPDFLEKSMGAKTLDAVQFYWINSLLSSPTTWIVNAVSNAAVIGNTLAEGGYAATKNAITGKGDMSFGAVKDQMVGMYSGLIESLRFSKDEMGTAYTAFTKDTSAIDPTHSTMFDTGIGDSLSYKDSPLGKAFRYMTAGISTPGRVLKATDELYKTVNYRGYLAQQASISGRRSGLKGAELKAHVKDFMTNPKLADHKEALEMAKRNTFTNDLGTAGKSIQKAVQAFPMARFIVPFIRTPTNILKYAGHHTPFVNKLSSQMKEDVAAGGIRKELAEAKIATGSMMFATAGFMASQGLLSGGAHEDYRNGRNELIGRQEYSVKIGDTWHSFSRLDPFGLFFGAVGDMAELIEHSDDMEWSDIAGGLILGFSNNFASKTYVKGLTDFSDAILNSRGDEAKAGRWVTNFMGGFIPNFMNQTNRLHMDNEVKEINEFLDNFKKRCYLASDGVMAKRDPLTGEKKHYSEALMGGYLQVYTKDVENDPVKNELYAIRSKVKPFSKTASMSIGRQRASVDLSGQEFDRLQVLVTQQAKIGGKTMQRYLADLFQTDLYQSLPKGDEDRSGLPTRRGLVREVQSLFHNAGNMMLFRENPEVQQRILQKLEETKQQQILAMKG